MSKYFNIGQALKQIRNTKNMSLRKLEHKTGIAFQTLSTYELNRNEPKLDRIYKIVEGCGSNMIEFWEIATKIAKEKL